MRIKVIILIILITILIAGFVVITINKNMRNKTDVIEKKNLRWDNFINDVCFRDLETLNETQRKAVLCFWYDAEMNSGGYSGYMDCYPNTNTKELAEAITTIGYKEIADNYLKAVKDGANDSWVETDMAYYKFSPSLSECLMEYVEENKEVIFD